MKNVTITLDEKVADWARIRAAERETSVSRLVGEMLKEKMIEEESYHASMQNYLSQSPRAIKEAGAKYPKREKLPYKLSWWDSLIVSAPQIGVCGYILTENLQENHQWQITIHNTPVLLLGVLRSMLIFYVQFLKAKMNFDKDLQNLSKRSL